MNGKDIAAEKSKTAKAEGERDNYKSQLDTAKEALAKFDGINVEDLKGQITKLQADIKAKDDAYGVPRACGGDPGHNHQVYWVKECSPCMRG